MTTWPALKHKKNNTFIDFDAKLLLLARATRICRVAAARAHKSRYDLFRSFAECREKRSHKLHLLFVIDHIPVMSILSSSLLRCVSRPWMPNRSTARLSRLDDPTIALPFCIDKQIYHEIRQT